MITVKTLFEAKINQVHVALLAEKPTTTAVANLHHVLSQDGAKHVYTTKDVTPEMKTAYQQSGINHKHFFTGEPVETIFHAIEDAKKKSNNPITIHVHPKSIKDVEEKVAQTHPNLKITVKALPHDKDASKTPHPSVKKALVKDMFKEDFEIGDYVTNGLIEGEILNIHPMYAIVVSEGTPHRIWLKELELSENRPKRDQLYKDSFIYKGFKSTNMNRSLAESFKDLSKDSTDDYAVLECLKVFDFMLGVTDKTIVENYKTVRIQLERLKRYSKKIGATYITEKVASIIEEELCKYAILEDVKFTTTDVMMVARVIAMVANIPVAGSPINTVNNAAIALKLTQLTPQGWKMLGRLMNIATKTGIKWQTGLFSGAQQTMMGLILPKQ